MLEISVIPCREQAGAQFKRGCVELIVTLRLIIIPFIAFIDFSRAHDRVPRSKLYLNRLDAVLSGTALTYLFRVTQFMLGTTVITAVIGVK